MNALKPYLLEHLGPEFALNDGEMIAGAVVIVQILDVGAEGDYIPERTECTSTQGLSFTLARGMIENVRDELGDVHLQCVNVADDGEDDVGS